MQYIHVIKYSDGTMDADIFETHAELHHNLANSGVNCNGGKDIYGNVHQAMVWRGPSITATDYVLLHYALSKQLSQRSDYQRQLMEYYL